MGDNLRRSMLLTNEEWNALYREGDRSVIRTGEEWCDCPFCEGGVKTIGFESVNLRIEGRCSVCASTGRILEEELPTDLTSGHDAAHDEQKSGACERLEEKHGDQSRLPGE